MVNLSTPVNILEGVVIEDYVVGDPTLKVYVPELLPAAQSGDMIPTTTKNKIPIRGSTASVDAVTTNYIDAIWYSDGNTPSPPHVRVGEHVKVFRFSNSGPFYWSTEGRDEEKRSTDRKALRVNATPGDDKITRQTDTTTYFIEADSKNKRIRIKTSKANGEPFEYLILVDAKKGSILITDDKSSESPNKILMVSETNLIQLANNDNSSLLLKGKSIVMSCEEDIILDARRQIITNSPAWTINPKKQEFGTQAIYNNATVAFNAYSLTFSIGGDVVFNGEGKMGINIPLNQTSPVVGNNIRMNSIITGIPTTAYKASSIDIDSGEISHKTSIPDVDITGLAKRTVTAFESFSDVVRLLEENINEVRSKVGMGKNTQATSASPKAEVIDIKGT